MWKTLITSVILTCTIMCMSTFAQDTKTVTVAVPKAGDGPIALVTGPDRVDVGGVAWFKTPGSIGSSFTWLVIPPEYAENFTELPIYGGLD